MIKRFPRLKKQPKFIVLNIRGTNGSGKSTLVRELMYDFRKCRKRVFDPENGRIYGYVLSKAEPPIFILGRYETDCGGCDTFPSLDMISLCVDRFSKLGHVVFEGMVASTVGGRWVELAKSLPQSEFIFGILDTPLKRCIKRTLRRREKAGNQRPLNVENIRSKYRAVEGSARILKKGGMDVRKIPHKKALKTILGWLGQS